MTNSFCKKIIAILFCAVFLFFGTIGVAGIVSSWWIPANPPRGFFETVGDNSFSYIYALMLPAGVALLLSFRSIKRAEFNLVNRKPADIKSKNTSSLKG